VGAVGETGDRGAGMGSWERDRACRCQARQLTTNLDIRLSDFGSSLLIHPAHPPTDGVGLGTLPFSPPELVDPEQSFSFSVDIFAFGATLYQCITGREPYRGSRAVEMIHHVRKGGLWAWEERERLGRVGQEDGMSLAPSPYPSAWRAGEFGPEVGVRRAGSLRIPASRVAGDRPRLARMSSTESLRASEDVTGHHGESPAGVKLWANWIKYATRAGHAPPSDPISALLSETEEFPSTRGEGSGTPSRQTSLRITVPPSRQSSHESPVSSPLSPTEPPFQSRSHLPEEPYADGSPAMMFLDGRARVDEQIRAVLRAMLNPRAELRPTAQELRSVWAELGVGASPDGEDGHIDVEVDGQ